MLPDFDVCYRAVQARDERFDGWFFTAVRTTGIYCRPSCPAITPQRRNLSFHPSAAAAQRAGYRACKRCRPDASAGSPEWNVRGDLAARALRLIADGVIDRDGVPGLAARLGYSERQVHRALVAEVGSGALALARAQRAQAARVLLETTDLPITGVAFAAGFTSVRQFNETVQTVFATSPSGLRAHRRGANSSEPGSITLRLPYREPMDVRSLLDFLGAHAVAGVETYDGTTYTRLLDAPGGPALVAVSAGIGALNCRVRLHDVRDLGAVASRVRRLFDLDADPAAVDAALAVDPSLAPLVRKHPGLRSPGASDGFETAVRTIVGQQISVSGARTVLGRIVAKHGEPAFEGWRRFPSPAALAEVDPATLPMPRSRGRSVAALAAANPPLDPGADRDELRARLLALPGIGPWTADYLRMRATSDPDVLLASDLAVRNAADDLGLELADGRPDWAPWRSYATHHLWVHLYGDRWAVAS
jgi:AraC family transcriptional regulator, regulatory protein of adaptative response / DNA-3-methyladenine glycosylase II